MIDAYERFFSTFNISKEQFVEYGLREIIYVPMDKAETHWEGLKYRIANNEEVPIRGMGRDAKSTHLLLEFYELLLDNSNIYKDATNNAAPSKLLRELTGYSKIKSNKYEVIRNYQISHIFGCTKNVYKFTAPWNIAYVPKLFDPFTGHEAKGKLHDAFQYQFQKQAYERFKYLIEDYNSIISNPKFVSRIKDIAKQLEGRDNNKILDRIQQELQPVSKYD